MLKISKQQLDALGQEKRAAYARDLARYLRAEHGDAVRDLSDVELRRRVRIGIARAERYGITWDSTITAFVAIMFEIAPTFDEQAAIRRVLEDARIAPDTRVNALWARTTDLDWEEAQRRSIDAEGFWKNAALDPRDAVPGQG